MIMVEKMNLFSPSHVEPYGTPAPLGLLGLAIGCAALTPIGFGFCITPAGLKTAAVLCLLFGAGGQFLAGFMEFRNRNAFGGAIFTTFSFLWMVNAWSLNALANGFAPDHGILLALDVVCLLILVPLTFGFGFFSKLLFYFLVDIDLLFLAKIIKGVFHTTVLDIPIALLTVALGGLAIWIALAALINPVAGRQVFRMAGPIFLAKKQQTFDWSVRLNLFTVLYGYWKENAYSEMPLADLEKTMKETIGERDIIPDLFYLWEFGYLNLSLDDQNRIASVRLNARGIDIHEQLVLHKYAG